MFNYWSYTFNPPIKKEFQLDLGQGNTPCEPAPEEIRKLTKLAQLFFKREDLNPNGSFKDRALAYQMSYLYKKNIEYCVLSSSGNAAISCCAFAQKTNIKPIILVSPDIPENKLSQIINNKPHILIKSKNARRLANYIYRKHNIPILNPSKDEKASMGFETLGKEIHEQNPNCDAIFSYSTSGASLLGIFNYYAKNNIQPPKLFASQLSYLSNPPEKFFNYSKTTLKAIKKSKGSHKYTFQPETNDMLKLLKQNDIKSFLEGASATVLAKRLSFRFNNSDKAIKNATVIISGKEHELIEYDKNFPIYNIETKEEIDQLLKNSNA